jgi:hypothetical protein
VIRTTLNYFLSKEIKEERAGEREAAENSVQARAAGKEGVADRNSAGRRLH